MAQVLRLRRGTTAEHAIFIGAEGEVSVDTDKDVLVAHDGLLAGGYPMVGETGAQKLTNKRVIALIIPASSNIALLEDTHGGAILAFKGSSAIDFDVDNSALGTSYTIINSGSAVITITKGGAQVLNLLTGAAVTPSTTITLAIGGVCTILCDEVNSDISTYSVFGSGLTGA